MIRFCHLRLINLISSIWITESYQSDAVALAALSQWYTEIIFFAGQIKMGTRSVTVTSMHLWQAMIVSKGHTFSWLTNLRQSTFSSLHCSTWLSAAVPRWICFSGPSAASGCTLDAISSFPRGFPRSRTTSARNGLLAPRLSLPQIYIAACKDPSAGQRGSIHAECYKGSRKSCFGTMKNH